MGLGKQHRKGLTIDIGEEKKEGKAREGTGGPLSVNAAPNSWNYGTKHTSITDKDMVHTHSPNFYSVGKTKIFSSNILPTVNARE